MGPAGVSLSGTGKCGMSLVTQSDMHPQRNVLTLPDNGRVCRIAVFFLNMEHDLVAAGE